MTKHLDIDKIIAFGMGGLSGDNCQPWQFKWEEPHLWISQEKEIARHYFNRNNTTTLISIGTVVELIRQAALLQSYQTKIHYTAELGTDQDKPWVKVTFEPVADQNELIKIPHQFKETTLKKRVTHRGEYEGGQLTPEIIKLQDGFSDLDLITIQFIQKIEPDLVQYIISCEQSTWRNSRAVKDIVHWIRTSKAQSIKNQDGLYWKELGIKFFELPSILLLKYFSQLTHLFYYLGIKRTVQNVNERNLKSSAGVMAIFAKQPSPQAAIQTGQAAMRCLLQMTEQNFAAQPLSASSLNIFDNKVNSQIFANDTEMTNLIQAGQRLFQKYFKIDNSQTPIWCFRFGKCSDFSKVHKSLRRNLQWFKKN